MVVRQAACSCGQLSVIASGERVRISVYESRQHPWVGLPDGIEHLD
jgi:hypothetical protein